MSEVIKLEEQIAALQSKLEQAKKAADALKTLKLEERIAIARHDVLCRWNHTDGCSWFYEIKDGIHQFHMNEHARQLLGAQKILRALDNTKLSMYNLSKDEIMDVISAVFFGLDR
jgi:small-conductance mechanosensitive channel